ncbi:TPA: hypothetical protein N0F65_000487 [Lagenidium giganteum]|uniref:Uncharacterized protein n=1 Tax=Lagenidium giganteum TaxID=4803 RepID=A0AAV2YXS2_9STRA|nr:TPA: hypothetical protein N0F65_000487 [Lagenidium giganteum]
MLPQPMDGRQQALQSPIKRKLLRPRRRKRRRRRRRGLRRTWHASHATWLPRASAEYIRVHAKNDFIGSSSKLMTRFAQLKQLQGTASSGNLNERKYLYAFSPTRKDSHHDESDGDDMEHGNDDGEDDDDDDEDEDEEDDFHIENLILMDDNRSPASASLDSGAPHSPRNDRRDSHIPTVTLPVVSHRPHSHELTGLSTRYDASTLAQDAETEAARAEPQSSHNDSTRSVQVRAFKPMLCHQAAWLSPELTAWLVASGMFLTRPKREV